MTQTPRILLAGCGYTGERCADFFSRYGWDVTGLVLSEASRQKLASGKPYPCIAADARDAAAVRAHLGHLRGMDALVHGLSGTGRDPAHYRETYVRTLQVLIGELAPRCVVFLGSTRVYPQDDGSEVTEDSPTAGASPTAAVLLEAEQIVRRAAGYILRLGGIYGPDRTRFLRAALGDTPPPGPPLAYLNLIHRDDAAAAVGQILSGRPGARVFNVTDGAPRRRLELANLIRTRAGLPPWTIPPPSTDTSFGKRVSNARLRATGWAPVYPDLLSFPVGGDSLPPDG